MSLLDLVPPHSVEAEQGVIGGLMLDNSAWDLVADLLSAGDFFRRDHRLIYQAIEKLAASGSPVDVVTVFECLDEPDEAGGVGDLAELAKNTPSVANISTYASIVRERSHLRRLVMLGYECCREASSNQAKSAEVQDLIEQKLFLLGQDRSRSDFVDVKQTLMEVVERIDYGSRVVPGKFWRVSRLGARWNEIAIDALADQIEIGRQAIVIKGVLIGWIGDGCFGC